MEWVVISVVAKASAAFGVGGSLIFVGFQVRQNSAGLRHVAVQSNISAHQDLYSNVINSGEMAETLWRGGVLDDELFTSMLALLENMSVTPGWQYVWRERGHQYDPNFQKFMDKMMDGGKGKALFPMKGEAETE